MKAEYVICYKLLNLKVSRHNKLFRNILSAHIPDWKERIIRTMTPFLPEDFGKIFLKNFKKTTAKMERRAGY
jgi:hypothetical protein